MLRNKEKKCVVCWKLFKPYTSTQKNCSYACSKIHKSNVDRAWKERRFKEHWYNKTTEYKHTCKICRKKYISTQKLQTYCSRKCFSENEKISRKWKWNPAYKNWNFVDWNKKENRRTFLHKYREFEKNAKKILDTQKDKYWYVFCQYCKNSNAGRYETHHIIYRSEKPKHINLHDKSNLIRLCRACHIKFHKDKTLRHKLIKERELDKLFDDKTLITRYE